MNHERRGQLIELIDITQRPLIGDNRQCLGDYEGDTVIGKGHKGVLVTLVDRTTREAKIRALPDRKADKIAAACIDMPAPEKPKALPLTTARSFLNIRRWQQP